MDLIVKSRVCRYGGKEYRRGERLVDVPDRFAQVLTITGKAGPAPVAPAPVGRVAETREPRPHTPPAPAGGPDLAAPAATPRPRRARSYKRRDLQAED